MNEGKNSTSESKEEQTKFNQEQYDRLIKCSEKGPEGIEEWNKWRIENQNEQIWLQGANLEYANLQGAIFYYADIPSNYFLEHDHSRADDLQVYHNRSANLQGAKLYCANLQEAKVSYANLQGADLGGANLQGAELFDAELQGVNLFCTKLQGALLQQAKLQGAYLKYANLQSADLEGANLQGADLGGANLLGAKLMGSIVDGSTSFLGCKIDENTDFRHTGLENTRIESGTKSLLKYNIRRMNWKDWYANKRFLQWPVKLFWSISNYGISTFRIIVWFFGLALVFAGLYYILSIVSPPGVVNSLVDGKEGLVPGWLIPFRSIYFSIVTMTTLGFGDMHANCRSFLGHLLLTIQVILGYVLLGAMVTRLAVLFTSDGPDGSFTPMDKKTKDLLAILKEDKEKAR